MATKVQNNGKTSRKTVNNAAYQDGSLRQLIHVRNELRSLLLGRNSGTVDPTNRDLNKECGYLEEPTVENYLELFKRADVANRVVRIWPDECWAAFPELYETDSPQETEFERAWGDLTKRVHPWHYLHRVDVRSGIGSFGVLLLGLSDGKDLATPAATYNMDGSLRANSVQASQLLYLRVFDESMVRVASLESDTRNARFGQPVTYQITFADPTTGTDPASLFPDNPGGVPAAIDRTVHWTRIVHVADNRGDSGSEIYGSPRLEVVLNRSMDIRKVAGANAEMFWKGGFPGYQFATFPDLTGEAAVDEDSVRQEIQDYYNGLQRYLTAVGGEWKSLAPQVADPEKTLVQHLTLLCAAIGVPLRIFLGTESGHLASTQDAGTWKERLRGRQLNYLEPMLVRPFVNRLMDLGCLPRVQGYTISWRDMQTLGDKDMADVALKKVQALMQYVTGSVFTVLPPKMLFTLIMGFSDRQADAVIRELGGEAAVIKKLIKVTAKPPTGQGGIKTGNPQRKTQGRPRGAGPGR
jgi:hypothetical protein